MAAAGAAPARPAGDELSAEQARVEGWWLASAGRFEEANAMLASAEGVSPAELELVDALAEAVDLTAADLTGLPPEIAAALAAEKRRQQDQIELIASENLVSAATLEALGSVMTNKTVEGYLGRRYYVGAEHDDTIERLAINRAKELFECGYANV